MKSRVIPFVKASACGNDFLIVDGMDAVEDLPGLSRKMCDRNNGIGADGVEWLSADSGADICARLLNADGSEAEISGNGTRCVAAYLCLKKPNEVITIRTGAGLKVCTLLSHAQNLYEFETAMGKPEVGKHLAISLKSGTVTGVPISIGNPHYVVFVSEFSSGWQVQAAEIGRHSGFTQGINVELVCVKDKEHMSVRFFERGVGETQSSGTGSCAAAVAAIATCKAKSPVQVSAPGGTQTVRWENEVYLQGPAKLVCSGDFFV